MNEEEGGIAFWRLRNRILEDLRMAFPQAWPKKSHFFMEISLLAAEGVCAREAKKVERGLLDTIEELEAVSKKIEEQMERLRSNNLFAKTDGIEWDLLRDYFDMKTSENEESDFNWSIRKVVFHNLVQKGVSHRIAYDAAMCAMYRDSTCVTDQPLPWGIVSQEVIERLLSSSPNPYPEQIDGVEEE